MSGQLEERPTKVPVDTDRVVAVEPGKPWPSTYRGSRFSIVGGGRSGGAQGLWQYRRARRNFVIPPGLHEAMKRVGKSGGTGKGSFRVTAGREVLTKVEAKHYPHVEEAPKDSGWIMVYLGVLQGPLMVDDVNLDAFKPGDRDIGVWDGLMPPVYGETWSVSSDSTLFFGKGDYRFSSVFDHSELVTAYQKYRKTAGRLYIDHDGNVIVNLPQDSTVPKHKLEVRRTIDEWQKDRRRDGNQTALRLVLRRLNATSPTGDPYDGHFPIYLGNLRDMDGGLIPKPHVTDESYFVYEGRTEDEEYSNRPDY